MNVGLPRDIAWKGRTVRTAIWKEPVRGRCRVGRLNLEGDAQAVLYGRREVERNGLGRIEPSEDAHPAISRRRATFLSRLSRYPPP